MLNRDRNILHISEFRHVSLKLEPRRSHVFMGALERIKHEGISHQKTIENLRGQSLSVEEIFKKPCVYKVLP